MYFSIRKKIILSLVSLILCFDGIFCQTSIVYASAVPTPDPLPTGNLWTIIEQFPGESDPNLGISRMDQLIYGTTQNASTLFADMGGYALGSVAAIHYWENTNAEIAEKIENGTLSAEDVGVVLYKPVTINGVEKWVPVATKSSLYGTNEYLITEELAEKIRDEQIQNEEEFWNTIEDYWTGVTVDSYDNFLELAENEENWVVSYVEGVRFIYDGIIADLTNSFPHTVASPVFSSDLQYLAVGLFNNVGTNGNIKNWVRWNYLSSDISYDVVLDCGTHNNAQNNPQEWLYGASLQLVDETTNSYKILRLSTKRTPFAITNGYVCNKPVFKIDIIPAVNDIITLPLPMVVQSPELAPLISPGVHYNVGNIDDALGLITPAVDAAINANPINTPSINPAEIPGFEETLTPVDWDYPENYPSFDENQHPSVTPDPDNPGGGGGGDNPIDPDNPSDPDEPDDRHQLKIPELLGLFPFCIPFDIKNAITCLEVDEGGERQFRSGINDRPIAPVFDVPFRINYDGRQIIDYTFHLDLSDYQIWVALGYIRTVEVICYIIVLALATSAVIF